MARKGFNPHWIKVNDWQPITGIPVRASDKTKRLLRIARKVDGVGVFSSPKFPSMLRIRYSNPTLAIMTIRSFTRQKPTVTITPRLQGKAFKDVFPEGDPNAWKPGKRPYSAERRYVGKPDELECEITKIFPRIIERILTKERSKHAHAG